MKTIQKLAIATAALSIVALILVWVSLNIFLLPINGVVVLTVILLISIAFIVVEYLDRIKSMQQQQRAEKQIEQHNEQLAQLQEEIAKLKEDISVLTPAATNWLNLMNKSKGLREKNKEQQIELLKQFAAEHSPHLRNIYNLMDDLDDVIKSEKFISDFHKLHILALKQRLDQQETPLSEEQVADNLAAIVEVAMICYDFVDTYHWTIENNKAQDLNLDVVRGVKSIDQALSEATEATDIPERTPRWIRTLKYTLSTLPADLSKVIFSGYKL